MINDDILTAAYFTVCKRYNTDIAAQVVIELKTRGGAIDKTPERYALWIAKRRWINERRRGRREVPFADLGLKQQAVIQEQLYGGVGADE